MKQLQKQSNQKIIGSTALWNVHSKPHPHCVHIRRISTNIKNRSQNSTKPLHITLSYGQQARIIHYTHTLPSRNTTNTKAYKYNIRDPATVRGKYYYLSCLLPHHEKKSSSNAIVLTQRNAHRAIYMLPSRQLHQQCHYKADLRVKFAIHLRFKTKVAAKAARAMQTPQKN